jgi:hypothetical protein
MAKKANISLIIIIIAITLGIYFNSYSEPTTTPDIKNTTIENNSTYEEEIINKVDNFSGTKYFHFGEMPITYSVTDEECGNETETIENAFYIIQNSTGGLVNFKKVGTQSDANIKIDCQPVGTYLSGEQTLGLARFDNKSTLLTDGEITFFTKGPKEFRMVDYCDTGFPRTEVHEILHVFGFAHDNSPVNIMKMVNTAGKCGIVKINNEFLWCLKHIYSNGATGTCRDIAFTHHTPVKVSCDYGWYLDLSGEWCCPDSNMFINEDGECEH